MAKSPELKRVLKLLDELEDMYNETEDTAPLPAGGDFLKGIFSDRIDEIEKIAEDFL